MIGQSCKKDETPTTNPNPLDEYVVIGEMDATTLNYSIKVYASEALFVGYNHVLVQVKDKSSGEIISNPMVTFKPLMDMTTGMKHACPVEQPTYNTSLQVAQGTVTFVMPSGLLGVWNLGIELEDGSGATEQIDIMVTVVQKTEPELFSFISAADSNQSVFVALVSPMNPSIGSNEFEVVVYERKTMMDWPIIENLEIEIEPEMPTMGHGSDNNEHPTYTGNGHYLGKVNFTMTGYWKVNMKIMDSNMAMMKDDAFFDIIF